MCEPRCPDCGSDQHCYRVAGPSASMASLEGLDHERAGSYRCEICNDTFWLEAVQVTPETFSPKAPCPKCDGFKTKIMDTNRAKATRTHICADCRHWFFTAMAEVKKFV